MADRAADHHRPGPLPASPRRARAVLLAWALVASLAVTWASARIELAYLDQNAFSHDAVTYLYDHALKLSELPDQGFHPGPAWDEWRQNKRAPLRTAPLILLAPGWLGHPLGHLATAWPALWAFLATFGLLLHRRGGSLVIAALGMALAACLPGMFHPQTGFAAFWLDLHAALWAGAGAFCLILWGGKGSWGWLWGFALFSAAAALSRYVAAGYQLVLCAPLLAVYLARGLRESGWRPGSLARPLAVVVVGIGLPAGYYLLANLQHNLVDYAVYGYDLGNSPLATARNLADFYQWFIGSRLGLGLALLCGLQLWLWRRGQADARALPALLWLAAGHLLFTIFGLGTATHKMVAVYALPGLLALALSPVRLSGAVSPWARRGLAVGLALLCLQGAWLGAAYWDQARHPPAWAAEQKALDRGLAVALAGQAGQAGPGARRWMPYFDQRADIIAYQTWHEHRVLLHLPEQGGFTSHDAHWRVRYPGLDGQAMAQRLWEEINQGVDLAAASADPHQAGRGLDEPLARLLAREVALRLRQSPAWRPLASFPSQRYGEITLYVRGEAAAGGGGADQ